MVKIIEVQQRGLSGDGLTAAEAAAIRADVDRAKAVAQGVSADWYSNPALASDDAGPGGTVFFTDGVTYTFADPIPMQSGQRFTGAGAILSPTGESAFRIRDGTVTTRRVMVEHLEINGGNTALYGVDFRGLVDSAIDHCWVRNLAQYGVYFGGTYDVGGWSNRVTRSRIGTVVGSAATPGAAVYMGGLNSVSALNANNNLVAYNVLQCNGFGYGYGVLIAQGGENRLFANDIGYGASPGLVLGSQAVNTYGAGNRYEKPAGAIVVNGGTDNRFDGDFYGTPATGYTGYNITVNSGTRNEFHPVFASNGSQATWISLVAGAGNVGTLNGVHSRRVNTEHVQEARAAGDAHNRFQMRVSGLMHWGSGAAAPDVQLDRNAADRLRLAYGDSFLIEGGGWNTGTLQLGFYHLWVDGAGVLRIKNGAPTSATDGVVVGTQT